MLTQTQISKLQSSTLYKQVNARLQAGELPMSMVVRNSVRGRARFTKVSDANDLPPGFTIASNRVKLKFPSLSAPITPPVWQPPNPHDAFTSHKKMQLHVSDKFDSGNLVSTFRKFVGSDHTPLVQAKWPVNSTQYLDFFTFDTPASEAGSAQVYAQFLGDIPLVGTTAVVDGNGNDYARVWFCIRDQGTQQELYKFPSGTDCARGHWNQFFAAGANIALPPSRGLKLSVKIEVLTDDNIRVDVSFFKFYVTTSPTDDVQLYGGFKGWGSWYVIGSRGLTPGRSYNHWVGNFTTPATWKSCYFNLPVERMCRGYAQLGGGSGFDECFFTFLLQDSTTGEIKRLVSLPKDWNTRWADKGLRSHFSHVYYANKAERNTDSMFDGSCANVQLTPGRLYNVYIEVMSNTDDEIRFTYDGIVYKLSEQAEHFITRPDLLWSGRGEESIFYAGDELIAMDGGCRLTLTQDYGELIITNPDGTVRWTAGVDAGPNAILVAHAHGDVALYKADGTKVWATDSTNTNKGPYKLTILPEGSLVLTDDHLGFVWSAKSGPSPPSAGDVLVSAVF